MCIRLAIVGAYGNYSILTFPDLLHGWSIQLGSRMIRLFHNRHFREPDTMDIDASSRWLVLVGCICAGLGVAAGAFGAHMLKDMLDQPMLAVYDTATRYQMYHAFGMVLSGFAVRIGCDAGSAKAGWMFLAGIFLFSGSLYGVSLLGVRWLGAVTPVGGALFILGWVVLGWRAWRSTGR